MGPMTSERSPRRPPPALDPTSPIPLYYQLKTAVLEDIVAGAYPQ